MGEFTRGILNEVAVYYVGMLDESRFRSERYSQDVKDILDDYYANHIDDKYCEYKVGDVNLCICEYDYFIEMCGWIPKQSQKKVRGVYCKYDNTIYVRFIPNDYHGMFNLIMHELEHTEDVESHFTGINMRNLVYKDIYMKCKFDGNKYNSAIGDIVYKLWVPTERNAWAINAINYDDGGLDGFCGAMQEKIDLIKDCPSTDTDVWGNVKILLRAPFHGWDEVKSHFIKQSQRRLDSFKKMAKRKRNNSIANDSGIYVKRGGKLKTLDREKENEKEVK